MAPLRGTVRGDALGGSDEAVSTLQPGGFATWVPDRELDSHRPEMRGWVPKRGVPVGGGVSRQTMPSAAEDAARSERFFTKQKGERDSARKNARQPGQRRSSTQAAMKAELQRQRKGRVNTKGYMTEAERAFQPMAQRRPSAEDLANPARSLAGRPVRAKRVDLGVQGETDEVIAQHDPKAVVSYEVSDIYPEVFEGAAGQTSSGIFKYRAKDHFVEHFTPKVVQDYVSGEVPLLPSALPPLLPSAPAPLLPLTCVVPLVPCTEDS